MHRHCILKKNIILYYLRQRITPQLVSFVKLSHCFPRGMDARPNIWNIYENVTGWTRNSGWISRSDFPPSWRRTPPTVWWYIYIPLYLKRKKVIIIWIHFLWYHTVLIQPAEVGVYYNFVTATNTFTKICPIIHNYWFYVVDLRINVYDWASLSE